MSKAVYRKANQLGIVFPFVVLVKRFALSLLQTKGYVQISTVPLE